MASFAEKADLIKAAALKEEGTDPIAIAKHLMHLPFVSMHGPEHHMLDGSAFLVAYAHEDNLFDK